MRSEYLNIVPKADCCGCAACSNTCPKQCIEMQADSEGFCFPVLVEKDRCVACGKCKRACPILSRAEGESQEIPEAYAVISNDEPARLDSSSGGAFSLLAREVLERGGAVFGAAMTEDCRGVEHVCVEAGKGSLSRLRNSKYMQSSIGNCYNEVKEHLAQGRQVLFTGTPCQIAGLKSFLNADDPNLVCADIICHGVPSQKVWRKYIEYQESRMNSPVREVNFRDKSQGWLNFSLKLKSGDGNGSCVVYRQDTYMQAFLRDCCLRKSCYHCRFKTLHRASDLTMADLWGYEHFVPEWNDDRGISLLLIHSDKGRALFEAVKKDCRFQRIEAQEAVKYNKNAIASAPQHPNRGKFFRKLDELSLDELVRRYGERPISVKTKLKQKKRKLQRKVKALFARGQK